jgi:hypothetical protein
MTKQTLLVTVLALTTPFAFSAHANKELFTPQNFRYAIGFALLGKSFYDLYHNKKFSAACCAGLSYTFRGHKLRF